MSESPKRVRIKKTGEKIHSLIWHAFSAIVVLVVCLLILSRLMPHSHDGWWNGEFNRIDDECTLIRADGTSSKVTLPTYVDVPRNEKITLKSIIPDTISDGSSLVIYCMKQDMVVYIGGRRVGTYMGSSSHLPMKWYIIKCYKTDRGKELKITLTSQSDGFAGCLESIFIGELSTIIYHITAWNIITLISGLLNLVVGIVMLMNWLMFTRREETKRFMYLAIYMMAMGVWLIMECRMNQSFLSNLNFAQVYYYLGSFLIIIPMLLYGYAELGDKYRGSMIFAVSLSVAAEYAAAIIMLFDNSDSDYMQMIAFVCEAACGLYLMYLFALEVHNSENKKDHRYHRYVYGLVGICILGAGMLFDVILYVYQREWFACVGMGTAALLVCIESIIGFNKFQKQSKREELNMMQQNSERTQFLKDMSHAIRTPANAVLGMNNMILRECDDDVVIGYARDIKTAGDTLLSSIGDILDFSDIESGKIDLKREPYCIRSLIDDCYNLIIIRAQEKKLTVKAVCDPSMPYMLIGDEKRIRQIIINLLTNAVKYSVTGSVTLSAGQIRTDKEDSVILELDVIDTGVGISKEEQDKMFRPYQRLDESKNRGIEGTGLGLSLTKKLIEIMDGNISVESIYGQGTKFTVRILQGIPKDTVTVSEAEKQTGTSRTEETDTVKWFRAPDARILAVDDVPMNLKVMRGLINETGISMDTAQNGEECLKMIGERYYDMIFMDDMMPGLSGAETYALMKKDTEGKNKDTPVIMLTANSVMGAKEEYLSLGFAAYIAKPIVEAELREVMIRFLPEELILEDEDDWQEENETEPDAVQRPSGKIFDTIAKLKQYLDTDEGTVYCMNSPEMFIELLSDYVSSERHEMIMNTYNEENWTDYRISVHSLKSTSKMLGADKVSDEARLLEEAAGCGDIEYIREHHDIMLKDYDELLNNIRSVIANQ